MVAATGQQSRYIVQDIFPSEEVHIIAGPSGGGKTTWLFQTLEEWRHGRLVHGFPAFPTPWRYIACDRSSEATLRTLERVGIDLPRDHVTSLVDNHETSLSGGGLLTRATAALPDGGVVWVDGIGSLTPGGKINDYQAVKDFLILLTRGCKKHHLTILGTGHATKTRENERLLNPRQRILGSVAWGGFADTCVIIEPSDAENCENGERTLLILPRNAVDIRVEMVFDKQGRLVERKDDAAKVVLTLWLRGLPDQEMTTEDILSTAMGKSVPKRTAHRWIAEMVTDGLLERLGRGRYRRGRTQ